MVTEELWQLKANYTTFRLEETLSLKSIYSFRIYELLKSEYDKMDYIEKKKGLPAQEPYVVQMHLTDLKLKLGIIDHTLDKEISAALKKANPDYDKIEELASNSDKESRKFKEYSDLKKNAIVRAQKELKEKTDIYFEFEPIRSGRGGKTQEIRFKVYNKNPRKDESENKELNAEEKENIIDEISEIIDEKIKPKECKMIAEVSNYDIDKVRKAYEISKTQKNIDNIVGWMTTAIRENYEMPVEKKKSQKSAWSGQFEQREIDFDELENKLLDN